MIPPLSRKGNMVNRMTKMKIVFLVLCFFFVVPTVYAEESGTTLNAHEFVTIQLEHFVMDRSGVSFDLIFSGSENEAEEDCQFEVRDGISNEDWNVNYQCDRILKHYEFTVEVPGENVEPVKLTIAYPELFISLPIAMPATDILPANHQKWIKNTGVDPAFSFYVAPSNLKLDYFLDTAVTNYTQFRSIDQFNIHPGRIEADYQRLSIPIIVSGQYISPEYNSLPLRNENEPVNFNMPETVYINGIISGGGGGYRIADLLEMDELREDDIPANPIEDKAIRLIYDSPIFGNLMSDQLKTIELIIGRPVISLTYQTANDFTGQWVTVAEEPSLTISIRIQE